MKKTLLLLAVMLMGLSVMAQTTYTKIMSASELEVGSKYIIVGYDEALGYCAMSYQKTANRHAIQVTENGGSITLTPAVDPTSQTEAFEITLGGSTNQWTLFDELKNGYLYASSSTANQLKTQTNLDANGQWAIVFDADGLAELTAQGNNTRNVMRFNENSQNGTPLFNCYSPTSSINVKVAFYKANGAPVVNPEPSNYPTNMYSSHDKVDVTIEWTDAVGEQLPSRYLVVASKGAITVPTDGVPVADGPLAKNVSYGVEEVVFKGLEGATTYNFAIFPYTNNGENINYKTDGSYPTASETTEDIYLVVGADFENSLAPFTAYNVKGEQEWTASAYAGVTFAKMTGYSGSAFENEDWLISPNLFGNGKLESLLISFKNAYKFDGNPLQVSISYDYDGMSDPTEFAWELLTDSFSWSAGDYEWQESGEVVIDEIHSDAVYLAFIYTSTTEAASTWEITDVRIYGTGYDDVEDKEAVSFNLYPNPATSVVSINAENAAEVQIFDMTGRMVMSVNVVEGENTISVAELNSGVYFVRMNGVVVKFVKK